MKDKIYKYSYPALSDKDFGWFRISGPGLANCLFYTAQAYIFAEINNCKLISPTWFKFSIGPWIRKERDKRVYDHLFKTKGKAGITKAFIISPINPFKNRIKKFNSLGNYFVDLLSHHELVLKMLSEMINPKAIEKVREKDLKDVIAVHVRLGDYLPHLRVDIDWYKKIIENIIKINPNQKIYIFSDGTDEEISPLLINENVKRAFYGNALADIWAISKTKLVIASDSTFSAWGAFIGKIPIVFSKRHFPPIYNGQIPEFVLGDTTDIPESIKLIIYEKRI